MYKRRGAMLCASVTVTPQSIDKTLDSLLFFFKSLLVGGGRGLLLFRVNAFDRLCVYYYIYMRA